MPIRVGALKSRDRNCYGDTRGLGDVKTFKEVNTYPKLRENAAYSFILNILSKNVLFQIILMQNTVPETCHV